MALNKQLVSAIKEGRVHHAYILEADRNYDKLGAAMEFAQALLCEDLPGMGCGRCAVCRRIKEGTHPDVMVVSATAAKGSTVKSVKTKDVEEIQKKLKAKPYEADRNIAIIADANTVTIDAYNKLLKTLEEPPQGTVIILLAENVKSLPQTIVSRAVHFNIGDGRVEGNAAQREKALELKRLIDSGDEYYKVKAFVETLAKGKGVDRGYVLGMLDELEEEMACDMRAAKNRAAVQRSCEAISIVEDARNNINANMNVAYTLKYMAIKLGGVR